MKSDILMLLVDKWYKHIRKICDVKYQRSYEQDLVFKAVNL